MTARTTDAADDLAAGPEAVIAASPIAAELRAELERRWSAGTDHIGDIARYALLAPGKMLRPLMLVATAESVGGDRAAVLPAALSVEYLHVASLVHDDIIDGDELRRGRPSVPAKFGVADAIVTGDALILGLFDTLAECGLPAEAVLGAVRAVAAAGVDLCRGQALEAELLRDPACPPERYRRMAALKTGALFRAACRSGAILGGGTAEQVEAATRFAERVGAAFQMRDDLLPYLADSSVTGKSADSDAGNMRPTFPVIVGHRMAGPQDRAVLVDALSGTRSPAESFALLREVLERLGAVEHAAEQAEDEIRRAHAELDALPVAEGTRLLAAVADLAIHRDR
ncbi:polyprenyl synthetase family protein [Saccharopolyspora gloriosae]|uniref:Geranylgeranyl diphosphate synthase type I n=1 Tax=Saccharopolyspora gloriosae TaxID=455344 RepID=A0A840N6H6_9PSEU|nr:polyprenyl synthetase family protein [Saccharopolyspora gloriosae]MBB5067636.1 geranylgeranyl diphosphate synthase type I [Saccharopolyspora gloriosae]